MSLAEHYIRIVPAEDAARAVSHEQWQAAVNEALGPLAAGATEAALTGLAKRCGDILAAPFPAGGASGLRRDNGFTSSERFGQKRAKPAGVFRAGIVSAPRPPTA